MKVLICLILPHHSSPLRTVRQEGNRNLGQEPKQRLEGLWLNHCLLSLLSEAPQDNLPGCSLTHNTLSPPTLAVNQENAPIDMPSGQSEGDSSTEIASSQRTLAYVKLTKPTSLSGWLISAWFSSLASSCIVPGPCCFISRRISQREDESYITGPTSP